MKVLRRNGLTIVMVFTLVLLGSLWWRASITQAVVAVAVQEEPAPLLTLVQRDAILKILSDVALDVDALVALNVSAQQAESILTTARTWQTDNAQTLAAKQADIDSALTAVRTLEKSIAMGPAQEGQEENLASAVAGLITARAAYQTALGSLRSSVSAILSESQRITWTAIGTGHDSTMPLRMLALTDPQRLDTSKQWHEFTAERAVDPAAAVAEWNTDRAEILTENQETVADSYQSNFVVASEVVATAMAEVLEVGV